VSRNSQRSAIRAAATATGLLSSCACPPASVHGDAPLVHATRQVERLFARNGPADGVCVEVVRSSRLSNLPTNSDFEHSDPSHIEALGGEYDHQSSTVSVDVEAIERHASASMVDSDHLLHTVVLHEYCHALDLQLEPGRPESVTWTLTGWESRPVGNASREAFAYSCQNGPEALRLSRAICDDDGNGGAMLRAVASLAYPRTTPLASDRVFPEPAMQGEVTTQPQNDGPQPILVRAAADEPLLAVWSEEWAEPLLLDPFQGLVEEPVGALRPQDRTAFPRGAIVESWDAFDGRFAATVAVQAGDGSSIRRTVLGNVHGELMAILGCGQAYDSVAIAGEMVWVLRLEQGRLHWRGWDLAYGEPTAERVTRREAVREE